MKKYIAWVISGLSLAITPSFRPAQTEATEARIDFTPRLQLAYFETQKLRLDKARGLLDDERAQNADNGALVYLDNYADMYYLLISEDRSAYNALSKKEDSRLDMLGTLPDNSPFKRFLQAEVRLHWAFAKLKFGNEVSGCWDIIKAYKLLEENRKKFPTFLPTLKSLGLLHVLVGSVPDQYTWVTKVLGLSGDIKGGLREMQVVQDKDPFFRQETQLVDLLVHAFTLKITEAQIRELKALPAAQPDNLLLHFFTTSVLMKEGRSEEALAVLNRAPRSASYIPFPFLDYMRAEILLQKGQYDTAYNYYDKFQRNFKGFNFLKDSYFKKFLCRWLTGRDDEARAMIAKVGSVGKTITESDQYASQFATDFKEGKVSEAQKVLLQARYASDGGYLTEANEFLKNQSVESFAKSSDKAEYNYRKGRILQKSGQESQAMQFFQQAIDLSRNTSLYFAPSSALQMGYIYMGQRNKSQAIASFRKAMSYKKHEYKNSIDNKARAALSELGA